MSLKCEHRHNGIMSSKKKENMVEATLLVAFAFVLFLLLRRRRQRRLKNKKSSARKQWVRSIFQVEARRAHSKYYNLVKELGLSDKRVLGKLANILDELRYLGCSCSIVI